MKTANLIKRFKPLVICACAGGILAGCAAGFMATPTRKPAETTAVRVRQTATLLPATPTETETPSPQPSTTTSPTPLPAGRIHILADPAQQDRLVESGLIADFEKKYPGIRLVWSVPVLATTAEPGEPGSSSQPGAWDVAFVDDVSLAGFLAGGQAADLSNLAASDLQEALTYKQSLVRHGSTILALPLDAQPAALFYRRDVFEKAGLPADPDKVEGLLATWGDYENICRQVKQRTGLECFANNGPFNSGRLFQVLAWQSGSALADPEGRLTLNSPELVAGLDLMSRFWRAKLVSDATEWTSDWVDQVADPKSPLATEIESCQFADYLKTWIAPDLGGEWGVVPIPAVTAGGSRSAGMGGTNLVMAAGTQNRDAAWAFMQFVATGDQEKLCAHSACVPAIRSDASLRTGKPDPYFAGQDLTALFDSIGAEIPPTGVLSPGWQNAQPAVLQAIHQVAAGASALNALNKAQLEISATPAPK